MLIDKPNLRTARINQHVLKAVGIDEAELTAGLAVRAQHQRKRLALQHANSLLRRDRQAEQRKLAEKFLLPVLAKTGYDARELEALREKARKEAHHAFEQQKSALVSDSPSIGAALRARLATRRQALSAGALPAQINFNFVVLDTPALILATSGINLDATHVESWNNTAKISGDWASPYNQNAYDYLSFVFAWRNPASTYALVNVDTYLALNGYSAAYAYGGTFFGDNVVSADAFTRLYVFEWWNQPPTEPPFQATQAQRVDTAVAETSGLLALGDYETTAIAGSYDVTYREFIIPPESVVVFEVRFDTNHYISDSGALELDFSSGDFQVMCPVLAIGILS